MARRFEQPIRVVVVETPDDTRPSLTSLLHAAEYPRFEVFGISDIVALQTAGKLPFEPDVVLLDAGSCFSEPNFRPEELYADYQLTFCFFRRIPLILVGGDFDPDPQNLDYDKIYSAVFIGAENVYFREPCSAAVLSMFIVKALAQAHRLSEIDKHLSEAWGAVASLKVSLAGPDSRKG